jgi:hypothetical protein
MNELTKSFKEHIGTRGIHVSHSHGDCEFHPWNKVIHLLKQSEDQGPEWQDVSDRIIHSLANYDPDREFLVLDFSENTVSIEMYTKRS